MKLPSCDDAAEACGGNPLVRVRGSDVWVLSAGLLMRSGPLPPTRELPIDPDALDRGSRRERPPATMFGGTMPVVQLGPDYYAAEMVEAVERLYPGCEWWTPDEAAVPRGGCVATGAFAVVEGVVVALLACVRVAETAKERGAQRGLHVIEGGRLGS